MTTPLLDALTRLQSALDTLASALTSGDAGRVLSAEEPVASAISAFGAFRRSDVSGTDPDHLRRAIALVRSTVTRCETLGQSAEAFSRAVFAQAAYSRRGMHLASARTPRRVTSVT